MAKQILISVSREYGASGHEIAEKLAKRFDLKLYDSNILMEVAEQKNVAYESLQKYDEKPRNVLFARKVLDEYNSNEDIIARIMFDYLRSKADEGESFVVVGRCSDFVLKDYDGLISIFVTGQMDKKAIRIMKKYGLEKKEALEKCRNMDKQRRQYHNSHADTKWGDSRYYDICIDSTKLGVDNTVEILASYVEKYLSL